MKIAIYDTQHYEMVNVLFNIFDVDGNELLFLVDNKIQKKMWSAGLTAERAKKHQFLLEDSYPKNEFYNQCLIELNKFKPDLIVLNTIDKDYAPIWKLLKSAGFPFAITVHNVNTWLWPPFTLNKRALSNYYFRRKIVRQSIYIAVQEELFINYIRKNRLYKKPLTSIPHTILEQAPLHPENSKIRVAIPGGIDGVRRDYDFALDVIEAVNEKTDRIQFIFLGKIIGYLGENIWKRVVSLQQKGMDIQHYYDETSNAVFDHQFQQCDLVFLPLNVDTLYEGIPEIYGTTKVTGVIYDMMRFAKPGFVPQKMVIPPTMEKSLFHYYTKEQLINLFLEWAEKPEKVAEGKIQAGKNAVYYSTENVRKRFWDFFQAEIKGKAIK